MKEGDRFKCRVDSVAFGGDGVAHIEDMVVFIPQVLPGELIEAKIRKIKKDYIRAAAVNILEPSPLRIIPECKYFKYCPGCTYAHADYQLELDIKLDQLKAHTQGRKSDSCCRYSSCFFRKIREWSKAGQT